MNVTVIRGVAVLSAMLLGVLFAVLLGVVVGVSDQGLLMVFAAMIAAGTSIEIYVRLSRKYLEPREAADRKD